MPYTMNPTTAKRIAQHPYLDGAKLAQCLAQAKLAQSRWAQCDIEERLDRLEQLLSVLVQEKTQLAALATQEMGKPLAQAIAEVEKCVALGNYYLENSAEFLEDESIGAGFMVNLAPLGILLGIMPWNFPYWQVLRVAIPNLMLGNVVMIKHADNTAGCGAALQKLFSKAGFPKGSYTHLPISVTATQKLIECPDIAAVSFTGSSNAGRKVAALADAHGKKTVLELGGSDPYIICADAQLESAVEQCLASRMINTGQSCIAAKRILVQKSVYAKVRDLFLAKISQYQMGNPQEAASTLGPLARKDLLERLKSQVQQSQRLGAQVIYQSELPSKVGFFMPAMILDHIPLNSPAACEELFGPVLPLFSFAQDVQALSLANASRYGLGAAVFTENAQRAFWFAKQLQAGNVAINQMVQSHPAAPFGGVKASGYGRELAHEGMLEFANLKTLTLPQS